MKLMEIEREAKMTTAELEKIGTALYGPRWQT